MIKEFWRKAAFHLVTHSCGGELKLEYCWNYCMESSHILHSDKDQQILFRYKGSEVPMLFNKTDNSENCPSLGGPLHPNHGFFGPPTHSPKWHLDRFSRFHRAQERDQRTDTHTDRLLRYAVCSNKRLSLAIAAMRPNNNNNDTIGNISSALHSVSVVRAAPPTCAATWRTRPNITSFEVI